MAGAGLGLRLPHLRQVCAEQPAVPWFEVHICNFLGGGLNRSLLREVRDSYPLSFHGVSLNLGGVEPLDDQYLGKLRRAIDEFQPEQVSEHACFSSHQGQHYHDLMPIPYTTEAVANMAARIRQVQDVLGRQILIENISRYYVYQESEFGESEFLRAVCEEADCGLLLDLNNAYVNQRNLGEDLQDFVAGLPLERIGEVHLAGFSEREGLLVDSHSHAPCEELWQYYTQFTELCPAVPCLIEWDSSLPPLGQLLEQRDRAQGILDMAQADREVKVCVL